MENLKTISVIKTDSGPMIIEKEDKLVAVSIELMNNEYVVSFDIINEENVHNFDLKEHDYETIGVESCKSQKGGFLDFRNYMVQQLDNMTIESFKAKYF